MPHGHCVDTRAAAAGLSAEMTGCAMRAAGRLCACSRPADPGVSPPANPAPPPPGPRLHWHRGRIGAGSGQGEGCRSLDRGAAAGCRWSQVRTLPYHRLRCCKAAPLWGGLVCRSLNTGKRWMSMCIKQGQGRGPCGVAWLPGTGMPIAEQSRLNKAYPALAAIIMGP